MNLPRFLPNRQSGPRISTITPGRRDLYSAVQSSTQLQLIVIVALTPAHVKRCVQLWPLRSSAGSLLDRLSFATRNRSCARPPVHVWGRPGGDGARGGRGRRSGADGADGDAAERYVVPHTFPTKRFVAAVLVCFSDCVLCPFERWAHRWAPGHKRMGSENGPAAVVLGSYRTVGVGGGGRARGRQRYTRRARLAPAVPPPPPGAARADRGQGCDWGPATDGARPNGGHPEGRRSGRCEAEYTDQRDAWRPLGAPNTPEGPPRRGRARPYDGLSDGDAVGHAL